MNPVFYHDGLGTIQDGIVRIEEESDLEGWYFWTETWADFCGPYTTEDEANKQLTEYSKQL